MALREQKVTFLKNMGLIMNTFLLKQFHRNNLGYIIQLFIGINFLRVNHSLFHVLNLSLTSKNL